MEKLLAGLLLLAASIDLVRAGEAPDDSRRSRAVAIFAPRPDYPYEARRQHMVGRGIVILEVDPSTGKK
jgi:hypothetical protein